MKGAIYNMKGYKEIKFEREGSFSLNGFVKEDDYELLKDFLDDYDNYVDDVKFFENADEEELKERLGLTDEDFDDTGKEFSSVEEMMADIDREMEKDDAKTAFIESVFSTLVLDYDLYLEIFNDYARKVLRENEKNANKGKTSKKETECIDKNEETITFKEYLEKVLEGEIEDGQEIIIEFEYEDDCDCDDVCDYDYEYEYDYDDEYEYDYDSQCYDAFVSKHGIPYGQHAQDEESCCHGDDSESQQDSVSGEFIDDEKSSKKIQIDRDELEESIKSALKTGAEKGKKASKDLSKATNRLIRASQPAINSFIDTISDKLEDYSEEK